MIVSHNELRRYNFASQQLVERTNAHGVSAETRYLPKKARVDCFVADTAATTGFIQFTAVELCARYRPGDRFRLPARTAADLYRTATAAKARPT